MKKNQQLVKWTICLSVIALLLAALCGGCAKKAEEPKISYEDLPVSYMEADFFNDPSDIRQAVGVVDYVFVGKVEAEVETRYLMGSPVYDMETGELVPDGDPRTVYTVRVLENIKGELITDEPIEVVKGGGVTLNKRYIRLFYSDAMPEPGKSYIFSAFTQENGDLLVIGPRSNVELPDGGEDQTLIDEYRTAYENEVIPEGWYPSGYVSRYDAEEAGK